MPSASTGDGDWRYMWGAKIRVPLDMPDDILRSAVESAQKHVGPIDPTEWQEKGDEAVTAMKKEMDQKWGEFWHVFAGRSFGSYVTHESKRFVFFYIGDYAILMYKSG